MASREYFDETPRKNIVNGSAPEGLSPQEQDSLRAECARTALALTALFDGEANIEEGLLARTHLEECAQCDGLWHSWNQQNHALRHLSAPVPPGLLTRILTAIRLLAALPQMRARLEAKITHFEPQSGSVSDARLLPDVVFASGANPFAPRRSAQRQAPKIEAPRELPPLDPMAPLPPAHLRDEILRRTIGETVGEVSTVEKATVAVPLQETSDAVVAPRRSTRPRHALRLSSALVPVLAAWLIFLSGPAELWAPLLESSAPPTPKPQVALHPVALRNEHPIVSMATKTAGKSAASVTAEEDNEEDNIVSNSVIVEGTSDKDEAQPKRAVAPEKQNIIIEKPIVLTAHNNQNNKADSVAPTVVTAAPVSAPPSPRQPVQPSVQSNVQTETTPVTSPTPPPALTVAALPKVTPTVHHRPATTAADLEVRTRRAAWSAPTTNAPIARRTVWGAAANSHVTAPQPAGAGDNADNDADAETLEHVNRLNDARPEDVRSVLDDFRASLLAEITDDAVLSSPQG